MVDAAGAMDARPSRPARSEASVKRLTLIATILGSGIALLDGTVVNVALPSIQRSLGGGLAGQLLAIGSWRLIFLINIPLVIVCAVLIMVVIPRAPERDHSGRRVDLLGALLCAAGLGATVFALIEQPRLGWSGVAAPLVAG